MKKNFGVLLTIIDYDSEQYVIKLKYGELNTKGEESLLKFDYVEVCLKETERLTKEKLEEGYIENTEINLYTLMGVDNKDHVKYDEELFSDKSIKEIESNLEFKLPKSYIDLMKIKNGNGKQYEIGDEMLCMTGFKGLDALVDMKDAIEDWGYPNIGIYFAWTESAGHEALLINYSDCIEEGVPSIWLLDQECENGRLLAKNFDDFIKQIYFVDFDSRYEKEILDFFDQYKVENDSTIIKQFFEDWGYEYSEDFEDLSKV